MSIFSDHDCGAMSDDEFRSACARMNAQDRAEQEHFCEADEKACITCAHWKETTLRKRVIDHHPQYYQDRNNVQRADEARQVLYITKDQRQTETTRVCEMTFTETDDDYCCEEYEEE